MIQPDLRMISMHEKDLVSEIIIMRYPHLLTMIQKSRMTYDTQHLCEDLADKIFFSEGRRHDLSCICNDGFPWIQCLVKLETFRLQLISLEVRSTSTRIAQHCLVQGQIRPSPAFRLIWNIPSEIAVMLCLYKVPSAIAKESPGPTLKST